MFKKRKDLKFSFIIPALNEEKFIGKCVSSIKRQSIPPWEIIVVDNGSSDKTIEVARKAGAKVYREAKRGQSNARNTGAKHATGDILCFFDADNKVSKNWLKNARIIFRNEKVDAVIGIDVFDSESILKKLWYNTYTAIIYPLSFLSGLFLGKPFLACRNMAIKAAVFKKLGGWEDTIGEDFWLSKKFWKLKTGKARIGLGMRAQVSSRGFDEEGYLRTLTFWLKGTMSKTSLAKYNKFRQKYAKIISVLTKKKKKA